MAIILKSDHEIARMREAGRLVAQTFDALRDAIRPGVRLKELDRLAEARLAAVGAEPLYKGYRGRNAAYPPFPGVICASVNEEVCHGIPDGRVLHAGDIVGIDIGLKYQGFCGDACVTFAVGDIDPETRRLLEVTEACLETGIAATKVGARMGDIGAAIQARAEAAGFSVVEEWGGHGIGRSLHEDPAVPHTGPAGKGPRIRPGMVFTIEPMVNAGGAAWELLDDGWTVVTKDGARSAQFEHTVAVTKNGVEILSRP
jgi:methionyl aminopeptidase